MCGQAPGPRPQAGREGMGPCRPASQRRGVCQVLGGWAGPGGARTVWRGDSSKGTPGQRPPWWRQGGWHNPNPDGAAGGSGRGGAAAGQAGTLRRRAALPRLPPRGRVEADRPAPLSWAQLVRWRERVPAEGGNAESSWKEPQQSGPGWRWDRCRRLKVVPGDS